MKEEVSCAFCRIMAHAIRSYFVVSGQGPNISWDEISMSLHLEQEFDHNRFEMVIFRSGQEEATIEIPYTKIPSQLNTALVFLTKRFQFIRDDLSQKPTMNHRIRWDEIRARIRRAWDRKSPKHSKPVTVPSGFRLVNVKKRRVLSPSKCGPNRKFVALSYV